jgi:hypothetical protein
VPAKRQAGLAKAGLPAVARAHGGCVGEQAVLFLLSRQSAKLGVKRVIEM